MTWKQIARMWKGVRSQGSLRKPMWGNGPFMTSEDPAHGAFLSCLGSMWSTKDPRVGPMLPPPGVRTGHSLGVLFFGRPSSLLFGAAASPRSRNLTCETDSDLHCLWGRKQKALGDVLTSLYARHLDFLLWSQAGGLISQLEGPRKPRQFASGTPRPPPVCI